MSEQGDSKTKQLKQELERVHVETAERVVCRRLDSLVGKLDDLEYRYCAECGRHAGHHPGELQCVVCDARDTANAEALTEERRSLQPTCGKRSWMDTNGNKGELSSPAALDDIRRKMIAAGIPSEHAASACGFAAEYAMIAYMQGHSRGYNQGFEWGRSLKDG